ncbi:hypothetical protein SESBI_14925 [Sesbania bispinosa]|nr:hypothetical protein SESBI_14925 [Sesbania bispinosa]
MSSKGIGYKEDKYGFVLINSNRKLKTHEPYILASQAQQVYYVKDTKDPNWLVVVKTKPRDFYDIPEEPTNEACQENEEVGLIPFSSAHDIDQVLSLSRNDLANSTANGSPVVPTEVVDNEEESDQKITDSTEDEENNEINEDDSDDN